MLELIFRGFLEWIYALLVEIWEFIADGLLDIMSLDFAYLQTHIPIIPQMSQILLAAGWALLLGNLVFQALKSMAAGLGFEVEDPKLLFSRTFVFAFLLLASPQICEIGLNLTSNIMDLLRVPDATDVALVEEGVFGTLTAGWLMAIICNVIVMFKVLGLVIEVAERYVILAMLTITAPLAFAMGGSKNTASIFPGWCRMFGSMCLLMVTNLVCCKMLFSVVSTVPSGLDVLPWMVLIFAIVKVAKKSDAIITRIGLNPAITGGPGRTLPGMLAYTVIRTAASQVVKGIGGSGGGGRSAAAASSSGRPGGAFGGGRFSNGGSRFGGAQTADNGARGGGRYSSHSTGQQDSTQQTTAQQTSSQQSSTTHGAAQQTNTRQENTSRTSSQQATTASNSSRTSQSSPRGPQGQQSRRSSYRLAPEDPPAMCRQPAALPRPLVQQTPRQRRRDSPVHRCPSRRTAPGPARQEAQCPKAGRSMPPHPGPAPQERPPGIPRRSSQMLHGPARQEHRPQEGNRDRPMGYSPARQGHRPGPRLPRRRTIPVPVRQEPCPGLRRPGSPIPGSPVRQEQGDILSLPVLPIPPLSAQAAVR